MTNGLNVRGLIIIKCLAYCYDDLSSNHEGYLLICPVQYEKSIINGEESRVEPLVKKLSY